jgi:hypothetical protein
MSGRPDSTPRVVIFGFAVVLAATWAGPAPAQAQAFQGRVYEGDVGDEQLPLEGVVVSLYGANNPYPDNGTLITSTTTDSSGWYQLPVESGFEFYHIIEENPEEYESVGATSVDGTVRTDDWIEYAIPLESQTLTGNKFWDRSTAPEEYTFGGRVYDGEPGDQSRPLEGVQVSVRGSNSPYPAVGELIASTTTNDEGWYGLTVTEGWEFYHIIEDNRSGWESSGATSVDGVVRTEDWIEYAHPLQDKTLTGNKFWDIQPAGATPTPTPTTPPGATDTPTPTPTTPPGATNTPTPTPTSPPVVTHTPTPTPPPGGTIFTICAVADAELDEASPNGNLGFGSELRVGYGQGQNEPYANRVLLRFDLSFIPPDAEINSATLEMGMKTADGATPVEVAVYPLLDPWDESVVTWATQPMADTQEAARRSLDLAVPIAHGWDVRELVQDWVEGVRDNHGVLVRGPESPPSWSRVFESRHHTAFCPRLSVTVTSGQAVPTPTPTLTATPTATPPPTCPQPDGGGDNFAAATTIGEGQVVSEYICPSGDVDWFKLPIEASQEVSVYLYDLPTGPDADLDLFLINPNGTFEDSSEIYGASKGEYINYTAWMDGDWRVMVRGKGGADWSKTKTYKLRVDLKFNCDKADEAGDTFQKATEILPSLPASGTVRKQTAYICPQNDVDYFKIRVPGNQTVKISADLTDLQADFDLDLYRPDGTKADSSVYSGTTDESVSANAGNHPGYWRVKVYGPFGAYHSWPYTLEVNLTSNADLTVEGIEVTQGIQDLQNTVELAAGKPTVARVYVDPGAGISTASGVEVWLYGWAAGSGGYTPFSDSPLKLGPAMVTNNTLENDKRLSTAESFNFFLPQAWVSSGDLRVQAEVNPLHKVAESDYTNNTLDVNAVDIRQTATVNVGLVPVKTSGLLPSIKNNPDVNSMMAWFRAAFPTGRITDWYMVGNLSGSYDLTDTSGGGCGPGWRDLLVDLEDIYDSWSKRPPNAFVYGLLQTGVPTAWDGCGSPTTGTAAGFVGANQGPTLAHEAGHVYKRNHAPSDRNAAGNVTNPACSNPANEDLSYPQYTSPTGANYDRCSIGEVGLNVVTGTLFDPAGTYDLMSYCGPEWISPYNWEGIAYNIPTGTKRTGIKATSNHMVVSGRVVGDDCDFRPYFWVRERETDSTKAEQTGPYTIELRDAAGGVLGSLQFDSDDPYEDVDRASGTFREWVPYHDGVTEIAIVHDGTDIARRSLSANSPTVSVTSPNGGEHWSASGTTRVTWEANDDDGDTLVANVLLSDDNGASWRPLAVNVEDRFFDVDLSTVPGGDSMVVKVEVSDGARTSADSSDAPFTAKTKAPSPLLFAPTGGSLLQRGHGVSMAGSVLDPQAGSLSTPDLSWYSSIDGSLGSAQDIAVPELSCGAHEIALEAHGASGLIGIQTTDLTVHGGCEDRVYVVPATAHVKGLEGTSWVSDVVIHNPGGSAQVAVLYFLDDGVSEQGRHLVDVAAGSSVKLGDLVAEAFGPDAASGGVLVGASGSLMLSSRTYNDTEDGTYGQYVPVPGEAMAVSGNERATLIQLTRNSDYRTNIGFTNLGSEPIKIAVDLFTSVGAPLGRKSYEIGAYSFFQVTDILGRVGATSVDDAYAVVRAKDTEASYFTYATIVDNRTGDPIYASPVASAAEPIYIAAAAHLRGINQTDWRTDLEVFNAGGTQARFKIDLLVRDSDNSDPESEIYLLAPGRSIRYRDVLDSVFSFSGAAALRITPIEGEIAATSRTFNQLDTGTTGQFAPAAGAAEAVAVGESARLIQLSQSHKPKSGYRTNIGFTSLSSRRSTVEVELYSGDGTLLGTVDVALDPYEFKQVNKIFGRVTSETVDNGYAIISSDSNRAKFLAYASVIDNRTGDPIYIPARVWMAPQAKAAGEMSAEAPSLILPGGLTAFGALAVALLVVRRKRE